MILVSYITLQVHSHVDVYDFKSNKWVERFDTPKEMAHSHLGIATDGKRYIYIVSGQYGPQCRGPTAIVFVLDIKTKTWNNLPPLPFPRYVFMLFVKLELVMFIIRRNGNQGNYKLVFSVRIFRVCLDGGFRREMVGRAYFHFLNYEHY